MSMDMIFLFGRRGSHSQSARMGEECYQMLVVVRSPVPRVVLPRDSGQMALAKGD